MDSAIERFEAFPVGHWTLGIGHSLVIGHFSRAHSMRTQLEQIRLLSGDSPESVAGANSGNGAFVAVQATIVAHLEIEGTVAEPIAALDAFGATDAELRIDDVLIVRIFDERALDGRGGTQLVLGARVQIVRFRVEIASAKFAIAADRMGVETLHRRLLQDTGRGAVIAVQAFLWVKLPNRRPRSAAR